MARGGRARDRLPGASCRASHDGKRVLVIGHVATRWALDHRVNGIPLEQLVVGGLRVAGGLGVPPDGLRR